MTVSLVASILSLSLTGRILSRSSSRYVTPLCTDGVLRDLAGRLARGFSFSGVSSYWRSLGAVLKLGVMGFSPVKFFSDYVRLSPYVLSTFF